MLYAQRHALFAAVISLAAAVTDGQVYRYQTYESDTYQLPQSSYDRNPPQSVNNPYNPHLNQYGQQNNYQNRPPYNQPGRAGAPGYRPNGYYTVSSDVAHISTGSYAVFLVTTPCFFPIIRVCFCFTFRLPAVAQISSQINIHSLLFAGRWRIVTTWNSRSVASGFTRKRKIRLETARQRCIC